ncbi:rhomboid-like protein [Streptomyces sp. NPDC002092]
MDLSRTPARRWLSPVPWGFALLAAMSSLTYGGDRAVNAWASTNLANMGDHPVEALITSAFLFGPDPWACLRSIALTGAMLAFLVIRFGNLRAVALVAAGQVLGTLVSEGLLAARISAGQADPALRTTLDVGPSYVIVSALAAVVAAGARQWHRWTALAALVVRAPHIMSGLTALGVTPVGHVTALSTGMLLAWGLRSSDLRHRCLHRPTLVVAPLQTEGRDGAVVARRGGMAPLAAMVTDGGNDKIDVPGRARSVRSRK